MFDADIYVKGFIDHNWLSLAILLFLLKGIANVFGFEILRKIYTVLAQAYQFIRPGSTLEKLPEKSTIPEPEQQK